MNFNKIKSILRVIQFKIIFLPPLKTPNQFFIKRKKIKPKKKIIEKYFFTCGFMGKIFFSKKFEPDDQFRLKRVQHKEN